MKFNVLNVAGDKVGEIELSDAVFAARVNEHLFYEVVKMQQARARRGTACTKGRSQVRGGGKKPYRQKGTGRARQGSTRASQWVGGGTYGGPKPRDFGYTVPRKVRQGALRSALSLRARENRLLILESMELAEAKTKGLSRILDSLSAPSALLVDAEGNDKLKLSARNLPWAQYLPPGAINVRDILRHEHLVLTAPVARELDQRLQP